jgi:hypothetical protein
VAEFAFDAYLYLSDPKNYKVFKTPFAFAKFMWAAATKHPDEIDDPLDALERAKWEPEVWDALNTWAKAQEVLSDDWKVALHDLWLGGKPKARKGSYITTAYRDRVLCRIAERLCADFNIELSRNNQDVKQACAASVLADLKGTPGEERIREIILAGVKRGN